MMIAKGTGTNSGPQIRNEMTDRAMKAGTISRTRLSTARFRADMPRG